MKKLKLIISVFLIIIGLILLMEGKISISLTDYNDIDELVTNDLYDDHCELIASKQKNQVIVNLYKVNEKNVVAEFSKNMFFDVYSLLEITEYDLNVNEINSVVIIINLSSFISCEYQRKCHRDI